MANEEAEPQNNRPYEWLLFAVLSVFVPGLWVYAPAAGFYPVLWQATHLRHFVGHIFFMALLLSVTGFFIALGQILLSFGILAGEIYILIFVSRRLVAFGSKQNRTWGRLGIVVVVFVALALLSRNDIYGGSQPGGSLMAGWRNWLSFSELKWWADQ